MYKFIHSNKLIFGIEYFIYKRVYIYYGVVNWVFDQYSVNIRRDGNHLGNTLKQKYPNLKYLSKCTSTTHTSIFKWAK